MSLETPPHEILEDLNEVVRGHLEINWLTENMDKSDFLGDRRTQYAVKYVFVTIGEALNRAKRAFPDLSYRVPELPLVIGFRNQLAHNPWKIADENVWRYAKVSLPALRERVDNLLTAPE